MRRIKMFGLATVAALALTAMMAASSFGANWDPPGVILHGHGTLTLTTNSFGSVTCTVTLNVEAGGDLAATTDASGMTAPPTFTGCTNSISSGLSTSVTGTPGTTGAWTATATSTTAVDVFNGGATINIGGICTISAMNVAVGGNSWSNSTHTLTANSASTFPITESGLCDGGSTGHMSGSITFPTSATIT